VIDTQSVAHDLKNLLASIHGHAALLRPFAEACDEAKALVDRVLVASQRAAELTHRLLCGPEREPLCLDVSTVVHDARPFLESLLAERIHLVIDAQEGLPPILATSDEVEQVLFNLVMNARDALRGTGTIRVSTYASGSGARRGVRMVVEDTGRGIPEDHLPRLFVDGFTTKQGCDSGLGLALVSGTVARLGGDVTVATSPHGTSFEVFLPTFTDVEMRSA